jgi:hypothetical protein
MMWAIVLMFLCVCFIAALWWKPGRVRASLPSSHSVAALVSPRAPMAHERDAVLEDEIEIIARLIREDEAERRRLAAMDRLASLKSAAKASGK